MQTSSPDWHVVIPVKGGPGAKSRLGPVTGRDRGSLARAVAEDTVVAAVAGMPAGRVLVVTSDTEVARWAADLGAGALIEDARHPGIDGAVRSAVEHLDSRSPADASVAVAVLLGDLPALRPADLQAALAACADHRRAVVPDTEGTGTVLLTALDGREVSPSFGLDSAARHEHAGHVRLELDLPGLRRDVDDVSSLAEAVRLGVGRSTGAVVRQDRSASRPESR